ncbi:MAG: AraC family transcriptional regulator [Cytophagales bacterium]|nr:AraC family transcriptional regulator [Cytophagales bacterium]
MLKKKEGFEGQVHVVLPRNTIQEIKSNNLINSLYITDIGYYPDARYHHRIRKKGVDQHILIYNIEGKGWIKVGGLKHNIGANAYFIIPPLMPHQYAADENEPWTIYWAHYKGKNSKLYNKPDMVHHIPPTQNSRIEDRIQLFNEIIATLSAGHNREDLEYANLCFCHLMASFRYIHQFRTLNTYSDNDLIKNVIKYLKANIDQNLKLEDMARHFNLSASHFSKKFKQRTRYSPINYFLHLKVQHSCKLLNLTTMRISEIARAVGIEDQFYFSRLFKKVMNQSPKDYRQGG